MQRYLAYDVERPLPASAIKDVDDDMQHEAHTVANAGLVFLILRSLE